MPELSRSDVREVAWLRKVYVWFILPETLVMPLAPGCGDS